MTNPPNLNYCKVYGNFKAFVADDTDSDDLPDFTPVTGTGLIWANLERAKNTNAGQKSTYFNSPIPVILDSDGDLSRNGVKYVMLLAPSPGINPTDFNYSILITANVPGSGTRTFGPYPFNVTAGGEIDVTDLVPVAVSAGTPIIQGPEGPKGDTGAVGPAGPAVTPLVLGPQDPVPANTPAGTVIFRTT
jgi:hypothetical protein